MPERVEDVTIRIDGERWYAWEALEISRGIDTISAVAFDAPFEPERESFRQTFQPFSYKDLEVLVGDEPLIAGTLVGVDPSTSPDDRRVKVSGYGKPGVLEDCTPTPAAWPLELNGLRLRSIAETLVAPFGLSVVMEADEGSEFRQVRIRPDQQIHGFLTELAQQRGLVINDSAAGALRFWQSETTEAVAQLREGEAPLQSVSARFSPQAFHSEITGQARTRSGRGGASATVQNPFLSGVVRPTAFTLEDTDDGDAPAAAEAKLGRMFGNALAVTVALPTWRTPAGDLWAPNTTISLEAPGAMIYRATDFLIRDVLFRQDADAITAELELVLPGAFSGEVPSTLPWVP